MNHRQSPCICRGFLLSVCGARHQSFIKSYIPCLNHFVFPGKHMGLTAVDYHAAMIFVDAVVVFAELVRVFFATILSLSPCKSKTGFSNLFTSYSAPTSQACSFKNIAGYCNIIPLISSLCVVAQVASVTPPMELPSRKILSLSRRQYKETRLLPSTLLLFLRPYLYLKTSSKPFSSITLSRAGFMYSSRHRSWPS